MRDIVIIDLETTGFDPKRHEILEVAGIRVDENLDEIDRFETKVLPTHIETASSEALEINGYDSRKWAKEAIPLQDAMQIVMEFCDNASMGGHNVSFDLGFLTEAARQCDLKPSWHYHKIDTVTLALPLRRAGVIESLSLRYVALALGVENPAPHRAMGDAWTAWQVLRILLGRFTPVAALDTPLYVAFAGIDGSGKTSCVRKVDELLSRAGVNTLITAEPSKGTFGKILRERQHDRRPIQEEYYLFMLDRGEHWRETVKPALDKGRVVLSDRSGLCTMAYQTDGLEGHGFEDVLREWQAIAGLPSLVIYLHVTPEEALSRIQALGREPDGYETREQLKAHRENYERSLALLAGQGVPSLSVNTVGKTVDEVAREAFEVILRTVALAPAKTLES